MLCIVKANRSGHDPWRTTKTNCAVLLFLLITGCGSVPVVVDSQAATVPAAATVLASIQIPDARIIYYDINGASAEELRTQLNLLRPVGVDGYKGDATTKWLIYWNWPGYGTSDCDVALAWIFYDIEVILPRWKMPADAQPELIRHWASYMEALIEHEKGHVEYVVDHSSYVLDAIKQSDCETAEAEANKILQAIRQHDIEYDKATDHGKTQGARFP